MCSHQEITWEVVRNTVAHRITDNSFTHKFMSLQKIRKRTKLMNAEIKKRGIIKNYDQYMVLKNSIIQKIPDDYNTDDTDNLSDVDYSIIHNSESKLEQYRIKNSTSIIFTKDKMSQMTKKRSVGKRTKQFVNIKQHDDSVSQICFLSNEDDDNKKSQAMRTTKKNSKTKAIDKNTKNINWQEIVKKNRSRTLVSDNKQHTDTLNISEQNISQSNKYDYPKASSNKKFLSPRLESQNDMVSCTTKSISTDISQIHSNTIDVIPDSDSQNNIFRNMRNREDSEAVENNTNSESNDQINAVVCKMDSEEEILTINTENDIIQRKSDVIGDKSNYSWNLQIRKRRNLNDEMHKSKVTTSKIQSSPINDLPSSSKRQPSVSKDRSCEKPIKMEEKSSINEKNYNGMFVTKSSGLINNAKKNLTSILDTIDCNHQISSSDALYDQEDSGIDEDSQSKFVKQVNKENKNKVENILEKISVPPKPAEIDKEIKEDYIKNTSLKINDEILKKPDTANDIEAKKPNTYSPELNQTEKKNTKIKNKVKKLKDSCSVLRKQQAKIISTEIINEKYKIMCKRDNDVNVIRKDVNVIRKDAECNPSKLYTSTYYPNAISDDIDDISIKTTNEVLVAHKVEHEKDDNVVRYVSPRTKKRLQQLNLIVDSDSDNSENENKYRSVVDHGSNSHIDNSNANHFVTTRYRFLPKCGFDLNTEDETSRNDIPGKNNTAALRSENIYQNAYAKFENDEDNSVSEENDVQTSHSEDIYEDIREQRETHDKDNVNREERLKNNVGSYASGKRHNGSTSNSRNVSNENNQHQGNVGYRLCNLEELIEDQELLVETLPASLKLTNISENEEAFILNIPDKVLQCHLQGQPLILKKKTIKFGKSKFRIVRNKVSTVSCIFATGKQRKPYKIVNLKEISTVTVGEILSHPAKNSAEPNSHDISSKKK